VKIIFFGSSDFSLHALKACVESAHSVVMVISTPPQKKGRGLKESAAPVHQAALQLRIPCLVPENLKSPELLEEIKRFSPDLFVVSSYGKMIPSAWLKVPALYPLNVHPSLLPKYRGAAPINWPILNGDAETGMTITEVTSKLDAGDIFYQKRIPLTGVENSENLETVLGELSGPALLEVFRQIEAGTLQRTVQDETQTCYARKLTKEDGLMDWNRPAEALSNQVRGLLPWPTAYFPFQGETVQVLKALPAGPAETSYKPSQVVAIEHKASRLAVQTGSNILWLERLKPSGKKEMSGAEFARGKRLMPGDFLK
jgi:methionyl-tRNA formyltransferase